MIIKRIQSLSLGIVILFNCISRLLKEGIIIKLISNLKVIIIFIIIEIFFYVVIKPKSLEMFFMIWAFISLIFLLYSIFNVNADGAYSDLGSTSKGNYANMRGILIEREYKTEKDKKRNGGGLFDSMNLFYLCIFIINIIGYLLVMPK